MATLPNDFITYTRHLMGEELYQQLEEGLTSGEVPASIRINPFKFKDSMKIEGSPIPWCPKTGLYLNSRPNFTFDPLLHAGMYYVQEASSMIVDLVVRQLVHQPVMMLDLCAAPGGKSTALRAALPNGSLLFSNEPMRTRSQILAENIQKFGHPDMIVTNNYPADYKKTKLQFDIILTDVPCSGEGMFRKDEGAIEQWSLQNVEKCWKLQREIVSDIWQCLKPNGILIYSTCTFNAHEDEENVQWIANELGADFIKLNIEEVWNITGNLLDNSSHTHHSNPVYRFLPGKTQGEGLFLAVLRKRGDESETNGTERKRKKEKRNFQKNNMQKVGQIPTGWLKTSREYTTSVITDSLYAIPSEWKCTYEEAQSTLKIIHAGIKIGTYKGKDFIPSQSLALSTEIDKSHFPQVELSYENSIRYLRKETVNLPEDTPRGYVLVTYQNIPLGWEKNIGNRANNLYPQEWKIKSSHIPNTNNTIIKL